MKSIITYSYGKVENRIVGRVIDLPSLDVINIQLPEGVTHFWCGGNKLTNLKLPNSLLHLNCTGNPIKHLKLNKNIKGCYCSIHTKIDNLQQYLNNDKVSIDITV